MIALTLEICSPVEPVVHERLLDGIHVLLKQSGIGLVNSHDSSITGSTFTILSNNSALARNIIDEVLDNELINVTVTLAEESSVPIIIRGASLPRAQSINDSIIGSFNNLDYDSNPLPRSCLYCRHFSMSKSDFGSDFHIFCGKSMDNGSFKDPIPITSKPHKSVLMLRESIDTANRCNLFKRD